MRIKVSHAGNEEYFDCDLTEVVVGRPREGFRIDLDLTPDIKVSRPHARILHRSGQYWIEDLHSSGGTQINGIEIKGKGQQQLYANDVITIGETALQVEIPVDNRADGSVSLDPELAAGITESLDASKPVFSLSTALTDLDRRLVLFYEIPLAFASESELDALFQLIVERTVDAIPGGNRGALLIKDRESGDLLRKASRPIHNPAVSMTLAQKAMVEGEGFIWTRPDPADANDPSGENSIPGSAFEHRIHSALYVPLLWKTEVLGVVCVDNEEKTEAFTADDLRLLQAVAHYSAGALSHLEAEKELSRQVKVLDNLLMLLSPQLRERFSRYEGRFRPGGTFRQATILFSDIRGFTRLAKSMDVEDVAEMIEEYFSRLVPTVVEHQGMIDKFVGDAILAVFGSPDADQHQYRHAVEAALAMQAAMEEINSHRDARGKVTAGLGIGIHCGDVVQGFVGSRERMEFTVIGDAVNLASRYCDGAAAGEVLISPEIFQRVWRFFEVEETTIPTKHEGDLKAYLIKGSSGAVKAVKKPLADPRRTNSSS